jgi:hypothetical protein
VISAIGVDLVEHVLDVCVKRILQSDGVVIALEGDTRAGVLGGHFNRNGLLEIRIGGIEGVAESSEALFGAFLIHTGGTQGFLRDEFAEILASGAISTVMPEMATEPCFSGELVISMLASGAFLGAMTAT